MTFAYSLQQHRFVIKYRSMFVLQLCKNMRKTGAWF